MEVKQSDDRRTEDLPELVFALVAPIGTDYEQVATNLASQLREFNYRPTQIKLSSFLPQLCSDFSVDHSFDHSDEQSRIVKYIEGANKLYRKYNEIADKRHLKGNDLLALAAINSISGKRRETSDDRPRALTGCAHILLTLKRPDEVQTLREVYGGGLHIIGIFATENERAKYLSQQRHIEMNQSEQLIKQDADDKEAGGQRTRDAFHLADLFLDIGAMRGSRNWKDELGRFLDLLFSHPYHTATLDEEAMFMAYAASLRSAQLGRQVGASIVSKEGEFLALGCNEVPRPGGGQYRDGDSDDQRDHVLGSDSNDKRKAEMLKEILETLPEDLRTSENLVEKLRNTSLFGITEYGRATHAEMEAILSCCRKGLSAAGATLFTTTFPCHNCARHLVGAGIKRVVYIEPYPKSQATSLHPDAIEISREANCQGERVSFEAFMGISPRKYADLFTVRPTYGAQIERKLKSGDAIPWRREKAPLRTQMRAISYVDRESFKLEQLSQVYNAISTNKKEN